MLEQLDQSGVPLLLCLTHADKLFANECIRTYGEDCPDEIAKRIIGKELEVAIITCVLVTMQFQDFLMNS